MRQTLTEHVRQRYGDDLAELFDAIARATQTIELAIRTGSLQDDVLGSAGLSNVQGEQQQKLDVLANKALVEAMRALPSVAGIISEEDAEPVAFDHRPAAKFVVIFDPLDGSSNIDSNVNIGTIVSVVPFTGNVTESALQPGTSQLAALYVNYGPSTVLVYTTGNGVHSFTLAEGAFQLSADHLHMPEEGMYYSTNEANSADFPTPYVSFLSGLRDGSLLGRRYSSRYVGSLIADFHRTLLKGGIFLYPETQKAPQGKLRLLYEANPLSFIAEQARGAATDGTRRILDISPVQIHQRVPLALGSSREIEALAALSQRKSSGAQP